MNSAFNLLSIQTKILRQTALFFCLLLCCVQAMGQIKTSTYAGKITGYSTTMGFTTGKIFRNNVVTSEYEMYLINIKPNGSFFATLPLLHNQECWISFPFFNGPVYFGAGKNIVQDFNIADVPKVTSVFKGDDAAVNNDMSKVRSILMSYDWDAIYADIYQFTPEQYKHYFLQMQAHKLALIDSIAKQPGFNKMAYSLVVRNVKYSIASTLMQYNDTRESGYRVKNKISFASRAPVLKPIPLKADYYDFLRNLKYNDPSAMVCYFYNEFMNRIMYCDPVYEKAGLIDHTKDIAALKTKDTTDASIKATIKVLENLMAHKATQPGAMEKARPEALKALTRTDVSLEIDLMYLQSLLGDLNQNTDTLTDAALAKIKLNLKHKLLMGEVVALNNKIKQSIARVKSATGNAKNELPVSTTADSILVNILNPYKGKVVFIDFWATWCTPCMQSIAEMKPLKEELAQDKGIMFLYITNTSSPEKTYNVVMPGIKGEHYRLSDDQYNFLADRFQINGIPHYAIVNKQGVVVDPNFRWSGVNEIKDKLQALEK